MDVVRVLVVDDEPLARRLIRHLIRAEEDFTVIAEAEDGITALDLIEELKPDVLLIDVRMPELDGFEVVNAIETEPRPLIVFLTAYDEFAVRAFQAAAVDYVMKPLDEERFRMALDRVRERLRLERRNASVPLPEGGGYATRLIVRHKGKHELIDVADIDWVESARNYLRLHMGNVSRFYRGTFHGMEKRLDPQMFLRVHRSAMVNVNRIHTVEVWNRTEFMITLKSGAQVPTSRSYRKNIAALLR